MLEMRLNTSEQYNDTRQAYDSLHSTTDISQLGSFYMWAIKQFRLKPQAKFLDAACGKGELAFWAGRYAAKGFGSDISASALWQGRKLFAALPLTVANGQSLPFASNTFDAVGNMGSLEHYEDMAAGVREMARVVKPGGWVLILVPNLYSLLTNILSAYRKGHASWDNQPIQRYAARVEWQHLLEANGLQVRHTKKYERPYPRTWRDMKWYLRYPKQMIRLLLQPIIPINLAFCFLFFCQKCDQ